MVPVGGYYTVDAAEAVQVVEQVGARIVVPIHYRTAALERLPIATVDDFLAAAQAQGWEIERPAAPAVTIGSDDWPATGRRVLVLPYE